MNEATYTVRSINSLSESFVTTVNVHEENGLMQFSFL